MSYEDRHESLSEPTKTLLKAYSVELYEKHKMHLFDVIEHHSTTTDFSEAKRETFPQLMNNFSANELTKLINQVYRDGMRAGMDIQKERANKGLELA
jgi:hypothetical protein